MERKLILDKKEKLNKKLIKLQKKKTDLCFKIRDVKKEIWELELDNINEKGWFSKIDWEYKDWRDDFECNYIQAKKTIEEDEILKKIHSWYVYNKSKKDYNNDYLKLYKEDNRLIAMISDYKDPYHIRNEELVLSIFAVDFSISPEWGEEAKEASNELLDNFAEKFNFKIEK